MSFVPPWTLLVEAPMPIEGSEICSRRGRRRDALVGHPPVPTHDRSRGDGRNFRGVRTRDGDLRAADLDRRGIRSAMSWISGSTMAGPPLGVSQTSPGRAGPHARGSQPSACRRESPHPLLLGSVIAEHGYGGVPMLNRLLLDSARRNGRCISAMVLWDRPHHDWQAMCRRSFCASGSRVRFASGAVVRRSWATDRILMTHVDLAPLGRLLKMLGGGRLIAFILGVESWRSQPQRVSWGLRACDSIVAISQFTLDRFREANPHLRDIAGDVCHLPARMSAPPARDERRGERVLVVGRLWGRGLRKGQMQLLSVWPDVVREVPSAVLQVVGDGEGRAELERKARELGVEKSVLFLGSVDDNALSALYARSDVYAMPSEGEGFGLVFAEAMAHGLPCVASRLDAGSEVVRHGETGLLVDPRDPRDVRQALLALLRDNEMRDRMGQAARRRADQLFSLEQFDRRMDGLVWGTRETP